MPDEAHPKILNTTLGQLLQNNTHAQNTVMQAMKISPDQFKQLLNTAGNNPMMNMTIGDLFKNGVIQKAQELNQVQMQNGQIQQVSNEQYAQIMTVLQNGQTDQQVTAPPVSEAQMPQQQLNENQSVEQIPVTVPVKQESPSFFQKLINLFK